MAKMMSADLRKRLAAAIEQADESYPLIGERFGVSASTVEKFARKLREGQSLEPALRSGRPAALEKEHLQFIRDQLKANSFLSSYDLARLYNSRFKSNRVHRSTVLRAMRDLGYSFKKKSPTLPKGTDRK